MSEAPDFDAVASWLTGLQDRICDTLAAHEPEARFRSDVWDRTGGGGGDTRVLSDGAVLERAGVNFSCIRGDALPAAASERRPELAGRGFRVAGVSVVVHPRNPYVPTSHCNVRFFLAEKAGEPPAWWFGGGFDLTPYYGFEADAREWHRTARDACAPYGDEIYPELKTWCDRYFHIPHRDEPRGIGGLFFDDWNRWDFDTCFAFARDIGDAFTEAYAPIVERRKDTPYGKRERDWQLYRRGRYAEFNLVYDRGTLFGLQSGGRTESILMSMPPLAAWRYDWRPEPGTEEARLYEAFLRPREWV